MSLYLKNQNEQKQGSLEYLLSMCKVLVQPQLKKPKQKQLSPVLGEVGRSKIQKQPELQKTFMSLFLLFFETWSLHAVLAILGSQTQQDPPASAS